MTLRTFLLGAASAITLSSCAATPGGVAPFEPTVSAQGAFMGARPGVAVGTSLPADWWRLYNEPALDSLIEDALHANTDVRQAVARIDRARAALRGARSDRTPQTSLNASSGYGRTPQGQAGTDINGALFGIGAQVTYELDLFGRLSGNVAAAQGDLAATQADADAVRVMVVADTTQAYAAAASSAARIANARSIVALLDETLRLVRKRHDAGLADGLAVARIEGLREQRAAQIPAIEAQRSAALFALAALTGRTPSQLPAIVGNRAIPLEIISALPIGDGAQLLSRRPDVRAAEQRLAASTARIGIARADLYPRIVLGASASSSAGNLGDLFSGGPLGFLLGPLVSWAFPNREPVRARIDAAGADVAGALAAFDGIMLAALQDTETALSDYARSLEQRQALMAAHAAALRAANITRAQNREGVVDSLQTLESERTLAEAQAALADQDAQVSRQQIAVFRALGGGWQVEGTKAAK